MFFPFIIPFPLCLPIPLYSRRNRIRYEIYQYPDQPYYVVPHPPPAYGGPVTVQYVTQPVPYMPAPISQPVDYQRQQQIFKQDVKQLREMFPSLPKDVIKSTLATFHGNKSQTINSLLEMSESR